MLPTLGDLRVLFTVVPDRTIFVKSMINQELADFVMASAAKPATAR